MRHIFLKLWVNRVCLSPKLYTGFGRLACLIFCFLCSTLGAAQVDPPLQTWALLGGYGQSIPGWGLTEERVQTFDLIPRYHHPTIPNIAKGQWYAGDYSTLIEAPLHVVVDPHTSSMLGLNFLACYTLTANPFWQPYFFGGGGPVYSFADIPGMGAQLNGNYQFGVGFRQPLEGLGSLLIELRYHHISNAGSKDPNAPLNSAKILFGFEF